jgi:hypothetical protein
MTYIDSNKTTISTTKIVISLCTLTLFVGPMMMIIQNVVNAKDTSTMVTCDGPESCIKTECINGDCETTTTNSSDTSSSFVSHDNEKTPGSHIEKSVTDLIKDRLNIHEN